MKKILLTLVLALSFSIPAFADGNTPIAGRGGNTPIAGRPDGSTPTAGNTDCLPDEQCPVDDDILDEIGQAIIDIIFGLG